MKPPNPKVPQGWRHRVWLLPLGGFNGQILLLFYGQICVHVMKNGVPIHIFLAAPAKGDIIPLPKVQLGCASTLLTT